MAHRLNHFSSYIAMWVEEAGRGFTYPPVDFEVIAAHRTQATTIPDRDLILHTNEHNHLMLREDGRRTSVEMARLVGRRNAGQTWFYLLNGDGFEDRRMQRLQTNIRQTVDRQVGRNTPHRMIIPFAALTSARLDLDTIVPIHIARDRFRTDTVRVPKPSQKILVENFATMTERTKEFTWRGRRYEARWEHGRTEPGGQWKVQSIMRIQHRPEFAARESWHQIDSFQAEEWTIQTRTHMLGATVFRATDLSGETHRWLSAFDQNEPQALYFLAQLPDRARIRYYSHALRSLAPKIVQAAQAEGRSVFRQGDIFAVATDLTDEDLADATVTHRADVIAGGGDDGNNTVFIATAGPKSHQARKLRQMRRNLMIYGTGHTATRVAVTKDRGTFVKGTMFHDPILENIRARRTPDHQPVVLDEDKWFLCVRNTVPRQTNTDTGGSDASHQNRVPDLSPDEQGARRVPESVMS